MKIFIFLLWSTWVYHLPLPSLPWAIDLQTFSGFWIFVLLGRGRFWILGGAEEGKAPQGGSHTPWHGGKGSHTSASRSLAVCYLGRLLVPEWGSGMWQPPQQLTAEKSLAKAPSRSHFVCTAKPFYLCFPRWLGVCPCVATSFMLPGAAWFRSKPWT